MARAVTIGNGNLLVGLDHRGQVRDFYYPYAGHANHVSGASGSYVHRIGVFVDGHLAWLDDPEWQISVGCDQDTLVGGFFAHHPRLEVSLASRDAVHNEQDVFLRSFTVTNESSQSRQIKLFISQQFRISESRRGDTGYYDPRVGAIVHYKGHHAFLVNAFHGERQFKEYNIGLFGIEGREGTFYDALDGVLERNPIEHGSVDSIVGVPCDLVGETSTEIKYWVACGHSIPEVHELDAYVLRETPDALITSTSHYWNAWLNKEPRDFSPLSASIQELYERSLLTMRAHTDNRGGIIASSDTDMLHHGRDTYSYVWPRDAAIITHAFDRAGYDDLAQRFFRFMEECFEPGGYFMHKYRVDGVLGSSWHPWLRHDEARLPIQEDETALVIFMLWRHFAINHDVEYIESLYNTLIEPAANFMVEYVDAATGLPEPSYDLWEEKYGTSTYTTAATFGALMAASRFAMTLGKDEAARTYQSVAQRMRSALIEHLHDAETGSFIKQLWRDEAGELHRDTTVDSSSFFGVVLFDVLDIDDERIERAFAVVHDRLWVNAESEGYVRYEDDNYYKMQAAHTPNPWIVCTMWMAQYHIKKAKTVAELEPAMRLMEWTQSHATKGGVLAEQMHPQTREQLSTAPLVWSHAEFVITVQEYLEKYVYLSEQSSNT